MGRQFPLRKNRDRGSSKVLPPNLQCTCISVPLYKMYLYRFNSSTLQSVSTLQTLSTLQTVSPILYMSIHQCTHNSTMPCTCIRWLDDILYKCEPSSLPLNVLGHLPSLEFPLCLLYLEFLINPLDHPIPCHISCFITIIMSLSC